MTDWFEPVVDMLLIQWILWDDDEVKKKKGKLFAKDKLNAQEENK